MSRHGMGWGIVVRDRRTWRRALGALWCAIAGHDALPLHDSDTLRITQFVCERCGMVLNRLDSFRAMRAAGLDPSRPDYGIVAGARKIGSAS